MTSYMCICFHVIRFCDSNGCDGETTRTAWHGGHGVARWRCMEAVKDKRSKEEIEAEAKAQKEDRNCCNLHYSYLAHVLCNSIAFNRRAPSRNAVLFGPTEAFGSPLGVAWGSCRTSWKHFRRLLSQYCVWEGIGWEKIKQNLAACSTKDRGK
jgi:hypothetical protein